MEILALFIVVLVVVYIQAMVYEKLSFKMLDYSCHFSTQEAFEGDSIELIEEVANKKWLPLPWLKSEINTSKWLMFADSESLLTQDTRSVPSFFLIKSYQRITRKWNVTCAKRGVFTIKTVSLVCTDLLKGSLLSKAFPIETAVMVLPQIADLSELFISSRYLQGDTSVKNQLIPDPFYISGVREYMPSDPMKNIHWNATAKLGRIMIRNIEYTTRKSLSIILNMQSRPYEKVSSIDPEKIEQSIRVVAALLDETLENNTPVCLMTNTCISTQNKISTETEQNSGREHVLWLFRLMAQFSCQSTIDFSYYLDRIKDSSDSTDIVLVTCFLCDYIVDFIRYKTVQGKNVKVFLLDATLPDVPDDIELYLLKPQAEEKKHENE